MLTSPVLQASRPQEISSDFRASGKRRSGPVSDPVTGAIIGRADLGLVHSSTAAPEPWSDHPEKHA